MITDPNIREQAYQYFLEEAPGLLETVEEELFSLNDDFSDRKARALKVNKLMRAVHTLKGGAANVGLETIKTVAHSLEDVLKALYSPELDLDLETQTLLFESYECLRLPLIAELNNAIIDPAEILDRSAIIFANLQDKLGDYLTGQDAFPSSEELGIDVIESFFEVVITEKIQQLQEVLETGKIDEIKEILSSHAQIFLGLAESLNLPGFAAIAQTILTAIEVNQQEIIAIAKAAINDLQDAQEKVLAGDRKLGGEPSITLKQLAKIAPNVTIDLGEAIDIFDEEEITEGNNLEEINLFPEEEITEGNNLKKINLFPEEEASENINIFIAESVENEPENLINSIWEEEDSKIGNSQFFPVNNINEIWGEETQENEKIVPVSADDRDTTLDFELIENSTEKEQTPEIQVVSTSVKQETNTSEIFAYQEKTKSTREKITAEKTAVAQKVRVNLDSLERLNDLVGEILIHQNKNALHNKNIQKTLQDLIGNYHDNEEIINQALESFDDLVRDIYTQVFSNDLTFNKSEKTQENYLKNELIKLFYSLSENNEEILKKLESIKNFNQQSITNHSKQHRMLLNMRDEIIDIRMSKINKVFNRFPVLIEQLVNVHKKKIDLKISGSHILIDKAVEDKLYDPLLHLVRNAFDHGIETADVRIQSGKNETGLIELRAYYQGNQTIIEVRDDGRGLNLEKIKKRALELNLISPEQASKISNSKLLEVLFEPGFSTASQVSDLSGRGIGLDVVRSQIEAMNGSITIESVPQEGTIFSLHIPLTLTIAKLMLCQAGGIVYALLIDAIEKIILPTSNQIKIIDGEKILHWENETENSIIPIRKLSELMEYTRIDPLDKNGSIADNHPILLLRRSNGLLGLEVERVLGEQELVIRPLGSAIAPPNYIYGCSILSNSNLTLVIDGTVLVKQVNRGYEKQNAYLTNNPQKSLSSSQSDREQALLTGQSFLAETLLVVDDSSSLRHSIAGSLQKISQQVLQAEHGLQGLEKLQQSKKVNLVVCDLEMPHMNGLQFLTAVRKNPELNKIPVIILTSRDSEKHRRLAMDLGAAAYLLKPYQEEELLNKVLSLIH